MSFLKMENINYINESSNLDKEYSKSVTTESYFNTSLVTIAECNNEYRKAYKDFTVAIMNENNTSIVNSIYKEFISQVSLIIDKFGKCMRDNHHNYLSELKKKMSSEKIVLDKNKLISIKVKDIYNYTVSTDIPKDIGKNIYFEELDKLGAVLKNKSMSEDQKSINILYMYTALMEDLRGSFYDRFRGEVIGLNKEISALEYPDELFKIYRDGGNKIEKVIEKDELIAIEKRFKDTKTYLTNTERQMNSIIKEYNKIKKDLSNLKLSDITTMIGSTTEEIDERMQLYIKTKTEQVLNMCSIHTMAYTTKLDAIASMYIQDRNILNAAIVKYETIDNMKKEGENNDFY